MGQLFTHIARPRSRASSCQGNSVLRDSGHLSSPQRWWWRERPVPFEGKWMTLGCQRRQLVPRRLAFIPTEKVRDRTDHGQRSVAARQAQQRANGRSPVGAKGRGHGGGCGLSCQVIGGVATGAWLCLGGTVESQGNRGPCWKLTALVHLSEPSCH